LSSLCIYNHERDAFILFVTIPRCRTGASLDLDQRGFLFDYTIAMQFQSGQLKEQESVTKPERKGHADTAHLREVI
jgi:hypothetical protein